jgi:hypothetical protein
MGGRCRPCRLTQGKKKCMHRVELLLSILVYILLNDGVRMWHMRVGLAWKVHMSEIKESQYIYVCI